MTTIHMSGAVNSAVTARAWAPLRRPGALRRVPLAVVAPLGLLTLWQVATALALLPEQILPSPARVAQTFGVLTLSGDLTSAASISLWRLSVGLALGGTSGFLFGLLLGASREADEWLGPTFRAVAAVPALGWIPILILLVGIDEMLKVIILTKACFVPVTIATRDSLRAVPERYRELGRTLGLSRRTQFVRIILPATVPMVFGGLRLASGQAFVALVTCEMLAATEGIGYLMVWGRTLFQMDMVIVGMLVVGTAGIALDQALSLAERLIRRRMGEDG